MPGTTSIRLPTRARDWQFMGRTVRLVLGDPRYGILAGIASVGSLSVFVLSRNLQLVADIVVFGELPWASRLIVLVELYPLMGPAYSVPASVLLIATALLVGIDVALIAYHLREYGLALREGSGGVTGVVLGTLGAGCATCGTAVFAGLLSLAGAGGGLTLLPLDGLEFTFAALVVLVLSIYWLADGFRGGTIRGCPVDIEHG